MQGLETNNLVAFAVKITSTMTPKPIYCLKKGLAKISKQIKAHKGESNKCKITLKENHFTS